MTELQEAVDAARDARLDEKGYSGEVDGASELLLGECQQNAAAVRDELRSRGIDCQVVGGALQNAYRPDEQPTSFAETKADGFGVHYWVEARGHVCEVASESELFWGEAIASQLVPEKLGYLTFEDSYGVEVPF